MLAVKYKDKPQKSDFKKNNHDITIVKKSTEEKIDKNGVITITPKYEKINLTRKINATAEVVKTINAEEKLKQLKNLL